MDNNNNGGGGKKVIIVVALIALVILAVYLYKKKKAKQAEEEAAEVAESTAPNTADQIANPEGVIALPGPGSQTPEQRVQTRNAATDTRRKRFGIFKRMRMRRRSRKAA